MTNNQYAAQLVVPVSEHDHVRGPDNAPLTLVEYGDYECPACGDAQTAVTALLEEMGDQILFVFRNFPLRTVHPHAADAARAAEAAGLQSKFWEMHDLLYEHQEALESENLWRYAAALGLNVDRFEEDRHAEVCESRVRQDFLSGARSGVNGTPTFFVNGVRHDGGFDFQSLAEALQQASGQES